MKKSLRAKLATALLATLLPAPALAAFVSGTGFGQALIYPYYTVQSVGGNAFNTYVSIVNGDTNAKALRVRVREGRNGREVAGFNLFLAAHSGWAAALVPSAGGAQLLTVDPACTAPAFTGGGPNLSPASFTGFNADGMGTGIDRLREGYIEVLEMASFPDGTLPPCDNLRASQTGTLAAPRGYLYGSGTLINVQSGLDFAENAMALGNLATAAYFRPPDDPYPDFDAAEIGRVGIFTRNDKLYRITMPSGVAAVEAAMVVAFLNNEVVLEAATASDTDWIVTMPTRRFHTPARPSPWFTATINTDGAIRMHGKLRSRSGTVAELVWQCGFLCPSRTFEADIRVPWAASVLGFHPTSSTANSSPLAASAGVTGALGSLNGWNVNLPMDPGGGALRLGFYARSGSTFASVDLNASSTRFGDGAVLNETIQLTGLPAVGFMVRTFRNGTLTCSGESCQGNYGGSSQHRTRRVVDTANP